jgi:ABC-type multidrug transport system fused ATPase/permease subunit
MVFCIISIFTIVTLIESIFLPKPAVQNQGDDNPSQGRKTLSKTAMITLLKPYFWPSETSSSAAMNRFRAIMTWVFVCLSKVCNLLSPLFLGWASTALAHQDYVKTIQYSISYAMIQFFGSTFKEGQSLVYLKVAQAAFVELSETTFVHLHSLSLDWHLRKKLGEVIRSMDRGISACDTLMKYLFLWLVPAMVECLVVCIIFATYFHYLPMAVAVFYFVWVYIVWTVLLTLWRKKVS